MLKTPVVYPADLPGPTDAPSQAAERRLVSRQPFEARTIERDRRATQPVTLGPMTQSQASAIKDWGETTLEKWGAWFATTWPLPDGRVPVARRWLGPPKFENIPGADMLRVSGVTEIRGRGMPPMKYGPPSAWNPDDRVGGLPTVVVLTEANRVATRQRAGSSYEGGVRGLVTHGGSGKWYLELEIISTGEGANPILENQNLSFGLVDDAMENQNAPGGGDGSDASAAPGSWLLCYTRFDGAIARRNYPTAGAIISTSGGQPQPGDVYGFAWHVGTDVKVYRNGVLHLTASFTTTDEIFPWFSAGATLVNGPSLTGNGESVRICTGKTQFAYAPPAGYFAWG